MNSCWNNFPDVRVIDAAYLLAGMEPPPGLKGIHGAPAMVRNLLNLIEKKTGAVALATIPLLRSTITQSEFQSLRDEFGIKAAPVVEINGLTGAPFVEALQQSEYQKTPEYKAEYATAWDFIEAVDKLEEDRKKWQKIPAVTVSELERKEEKISALTASIDALMERGFSTEPQPAQEPQATTTSPAPVVTPEPKAAPVVAVSDPERRLAALRALGGSYKFKRGRDGVQAWQFTGIKKLVTQEKADERKRSDEKTIRDDLREAAESESMEKRNAWNK